MQDFTIIESGSGFQEWLEKKKIAVDIIEKAVMDKKISSWNLYVSWVHPLTDNV